MSHPPPNPRRKTDRKAIEGLAASIKQDGILHNLVVTATGNGKKKRFQIVSGARRLEALKLLHERGELPEYRYEMRDAEFLFLRPVAQECGLAVLKPELVTLVWGLSVSTKKTSCL